MPGTRTAPTIDGAPASKLISVRWIDASGDSRSDSYRVLTAASALIIEALIAALQAGSNASCWSVTVTEEYFGAKDKSNGVADAGKSESVHDQLAFSLKHVSDPDKRVKRLIFPAPIGSMFVAGSDTLDPTSAEIIAGLAAILPAIGVASWDTVHGTYTEKTEVNEKVPI